MNVKLAIAALSIAAFSSAPAFCSTIDFTGNNSDIGHSHTYGVVTAYAFQDETCWGNWCGDESPLHLYGKKGGGAENGVGIAGNSDNEIDNQSFVQLDVSKLTSSFTLTIGSTQSEEGFSVYVSNLLGEIGAVSHDYHNPSLDPFTTQLIDMPKGYSYVSIHADGNPDGNGNVLLDSLTTAAPTPEPNSLVLLGTGIIGAAGALRRRMAA